MPRICLVTHFFPPHMGGIEKVSYEQSKRLTEVGYTFDVLTSKVEGQSLNPVKGMSVEVTDDCIGCGQCESTCFLDAIQVINGRAVIDAYCRVCGRCAGACPQDAIKLKLDNPNAADDVVNRILAKVDLS